MGDYFRNKVAVITGAAVDALGAIKEDDLKKEAERLNAQYPGKVHPLPTDVTKPEQVQSLAGAARSFEDRLDFVFNNVGIGMTLPTEKVTFDLWRRIGDLNLLMMCQRAAERRGNYRTKGTYSQVRIVYGTYSGGPKGAPAIFKPSRGPSGGRLRPRLLQPVEHIQ